MFKNAKTNVPAIAFFIIICFHDIMFVISSELWSYKYKRDVKVENLFGVWYIGFRKVSDI